MSTAEHTARVPAGETSPLPTWIADTLRQYDLEHREPGAIEELLALPEVALVAYYRYTRQGQPSPTASRRAATALLTRYGGVVRALSGTAFLPGMDRLVADVGETLPEATTMFQQGWLGFLEAIERYDPTVRGAANRQAGLRTYAGYYIKLRVQEVYVQGMRLPYGHSDDARVYAKIQAVTEALRQASGHEPTTRELADTLAGDLDLCARLGNTNKVRERVKAVLDTLKAPVLSVGPGSDEDELDDAGVDVEDESAWGKPEPNLLEREIGHANHTALLTLFTRAQARLGPDGAQQLLVLQILLSLTPAELPRARDPHRLPAPTGPILEGQFNLRQIASRLNHPDAAIVDLWAWLHPALGLGRYMLPADWAGVCSLFVRPASETGLRQFLYYSLRRAGWFSQARVQDNPVQFLGGFQQSQLYAEAQAAFYGGRGLSSPAGAAGDPSFEEAEAAKLALVRYAQTCCQIVYNPNCYPGRARGKIDGYRAAVRRASGLGANEVPPPPGAMPQALAACAPEHHAAGEELRAATIAPAILLALALVRLLLVAEGLIDYAAAAAQYAVPP